MLLGFSAQAAHVMLNLIASNNNNNSG